MTSRSEQDYLKAIFELHHDKGGEWAATSGLAQRLGVSPASVTEMVKKLAGLNPPLVVHEPYLGARLTEAGEKAALEVVRRHRLIESFLCAALGYTWDRVHAEAHQLEHAVSEELEENIARYLGEPSRDPHGSPIPQRNGALEALDDMPLAQVPQGKVAAVRRVLDDDPDLLRYLSDLGMVLGTRLEVVERVPFEGPLQVRMLDSSSVHALGAGVTERVFVVMEQQEVTN